MSLQGWSFDTLVWTLFFLDHFPPISGTLFFSEHLNWQVLLITRLQLFSTRVLDIHLGGLKAACIGLDVSKFRPSVGDGATYYTDLYRLTQKMYFVINKTLSDSYQNIL